MHLSLSLFISLLVFAFTGTTARAQSITVQGRVVDAGGAAVNGPATLFRVQILTPDSNRCVLFDETHTLDLSSSSGLFSINLNNGLGVRDIPTTYTLEQALGNAGGFAINSAHCLSPSGGGTMTYSPAFDANRKIRILFRDPATMTAFEEIPEMDVNPVPFAVDSRNVGGFSSANLLRVVSGSSPAPAAAFTSAQFSDLQAIIAGTSTKYMASGTGISTGALLPTTVNADPASATAGSIWFDTGTGELKYHDGSSAQVVGSASAAGDITNVSAGTGLSGGGASGSVTLSLATSGVTAASYGSASAVPVLTVDAYGRITAATTAAITGTLPVGTNGQFLKSNGTAWSSQSITMADLRSTIGGASLFDNPGCTSAQTLYWDSGADQIKCQAIGGLNASVITAGTIDAARLPAGADAWTVASGNVYRSTGNVGIGTTNPSEKLHMQSGWIYTPYTANQTDGYRLALGNTSGFIWRNYAGGTGHGAGYIADALVLSNNWRLDDAGADLVPSAVNPTSAILLQKSNIYFSTGAAGAAPSAKVTILNNGNLGIGTTAPTATLHLKAGTATAGTAPLKFSAGTSLTTPENGTLEYDGTDLFLTSGGVRRRLAATAGSNDFTGVGSIVGSGALSITAGGSNQNLTLAGSGTGQVQSTSILNVTNSTASTSSSTGALIVNGGIGVSGAINSGGSISAATSMRSPQIYGSAAASGTLSLDGTSDATKGHVLLNSAGGNVGIGTTAPAGTLEVVSTAASSTLHPYRGGIFASAQGSDVGARFVARHAGAETPMFNTYRSLGTLASPSAVTAGYKIGQLSQFAFDGTSYQTGGNTSIISIATEDHSSSAHGAALYFETTANGTTGVVERMRIDHSGNVGITTTNPRERLDLGGIAFHHGGSLGVKFNQYWNQENTRNEYAGYNGGSAFAADIGFDPTGGLLVLGVTPSAGAAGAPTANNPSKLVMNSSGHVGIGVASPAAPLDVGGLFGITLFKNPTADNNYLTSSIGMNSFWNGSNWVTKTDGLTNGGALISSDVHGGIHFLTLPSTGATNQSIVDSSIRNYERVTIAPSGSVGIGTSVPTAALQLKAGTATAGTAPLKFTSGTNLTTPENGAVEYDGTDLFFTSGGVRRRLASTVAGTSDFTGVNSITGGSGTFAITAGGTNQNLVLAGSGMGQVQSPSILNITNNTASTSPTTGALVVAGGLGVSGAINSGSTISADTSMTAPQIYGSAAASGTLRLDGTSHGTKGSLLLNSAGGNVGIGTTNPGKALEVAASGTGDPSVGNLSGLAVLNLDTTSAGKSGITFRGTDSGGSGRHMAAILGGKSDSWTSGDITTWDSYLGFWTRNDGADEAERMRITSVGNVGIGSASPATRLDVVGAGAAGTGSVIASFKAVGAADRISIVDETTAGAKPPGISSKVALWGLGFYAEAGPTIFYRGAGATESARIDTSGNVAIGTSSPVSKLTIDVNGTNARQIASGSASKWSDMSGSGGGYAAFGSNFYLGSNDNAFRYSHNHPGIGSGGLIVNWPTWGDVTFSADYGATTADATFTPSARMTIKPSGNIGIGTTAPDARFVVQKASQNYAMNTTSALSLQDGTTPAKRLHAGYDATADAGYIDSTHTAVGPKALLLNPTGGNVGIATTNPSDLLHVAGRIRGNDYVETQTGVTSNLYYTTGFNYRNNGYAYYLGMRQDANYAFMQVYPSGTAGAAATPVTAMVWTVAGNVGIGNLTPAYKLDVTGGVNATLGYTQVSDLSLKTNLEPLHESLNKILSLRTIRYDWRDSEKYGREKQIGLIAQDVEKAFPEAVKRNQEGLLSVSYPNLVAPVIDALRELYAALSGTQAEVAALKAENARLKAADETKARDIASVKQENAAKAKELAEMKARLDRLERALQAK